MQLAQLSWRHLSCWWATSVWNTGPMIIGLSASGRRWSFSGIGYGRPLSPCPELWPGLRQLMSSPRQSSLSLLSMISVMLYTTTGLTQWEFLWHQYELSICWNKGKSINKENLHNFLLVWCWWSSLEICFTALFSLVKSFLSLWAAGRTTGCEDSVSSNRDCVNMREAHRVSSWLTVLLLSQAQTIPEQRCISELH